MPRVRLATWIEASPERVFDLARSIDLHAQGQALHGERAIAGVTQPSHELALARVATRAGSGDSIRNSRCQALERRRWWCRSCPAFSGGCGSTEVAHFRSGGSLPGSTRLGVSGRVGMSCVWCPRIHPNPRGQAVRTKTPLPCRSIRSRQDFADDTAGNAVTDFPIVGLAQGDATNASRQFLGAPDGFRHAAGAGRVAEPIRSTQKQIGRAHV